jgi:hypothetical protein
MKLLAGTYKENSQIFNEVFYLPLYLPLWIRTSRRLDTFLHEAAQNFEVFSNIPE